MDKRASTYVHLHCIPKCLSINLPWMGRSGSVGCWQEGLPFHQLVNIHLVVWLGDIVEPYIQTNTLQCHGV